MKQMKLLIKNTPQRKTTNPNIFPGEFYQTFKGKNIPTLNKHFVRSQREGNTS